MVNGCEMFFSKEKMIQRITAEGRTDMIDEVVMSIMDNLDGQPVGTNSWQRQGITPAYAGQIFKAFRAKPVT